MLTKVLELLVDHSQVLICQAESFSVCKAFDTSHLIQEYQVIILDVEIDRVKELLQNLSINQINTSLFQSHVHDTTQDLEQIFQHILLSVLIKVLDLVTECQHELVFLKFDVF